jgi:hypothetical protein
MMFEKITRRIAVLTPERCLQYASAKTLQVVSIHFQQTNSAVRASEIKRTSKPQY